jgi:hypothetical protein
MAQHDYILANAAGASFRADANNALAAIVSQNSGPNQPNETYAFQFWAHTAEGLLKQRNAANDGWISLFRLDAAFSLIPPADGSVTTAKLADGVLAASTPGRAKMADEFITQAKLAPAVQALLLTDGSVTTAKLVDAAVTPAKLSQPLTRATAIAATSGTSIDFTSIPGWVRRITVLFTSVSSSGVSPLQIQIGDSGGVETTGYTTTSVAVISTNSLNIASYTTGAVLIGAFATNVRSGSMVITNIDGNQWQFSSIMALDDVGYLGWTSAIKTLSATLDRVRLTTINGTDTFDGGTVNIIYEG